LLKQVADCENAATDQQEDEHTGGAEVVRARQIPGHPHWKQNQAGQLEEASELVKHDLPLSLQSDYSRFREIADRIFSILTDRRTMKSVRDPKTQRRCAAWYGMRIAKGVCVARPGSTQYNMH
jgi:hypothetical protein